MSDFEFERLTEEQLAEVVRGLEAAAYEAKQWTLLPRQQYAEDRCNEGAQPGVRFEMLFGGAAGPGKTAFALWHLHHIALNFPGTRSLMLRRSFPELRRNAIYKSHEMFDRRRCRWVESKREWVFDNDAVIEMGYLDNDFDVYQYQGAEYVCVAPETEIVMGDDTLRRIDAVRPGDSVMTLEGPRRVLRSQAVPAKPTVAITTPWGTVVAAADHALLTAAGDWRTPLALRPTTRRASGTTSAAWPRSRRGMRQRRAYRKWAKRRDRALVQQGRRVAVRQGSDASGSTLGIDDAASCASPLRPQPLAPWFASLAVHELAPRRLAQAARDRARERATADREAPGSLADCHSGLHSDDARPHGAAAADRAHTPAQGDAAGPSWLPCDAGDPARTPARNPTGATYSHPYTTEGRPLAVGVLHVRAALDPAGVRDLWDIEVEDSNHYLSSNGSIHRNCVAFEELTQWPTDFAYRYLLSRLRTSRAISLAGLVPHAIATANPGGIGHGWVKDRFIDVADPDEMFESTDVVQGVPITERRLFVPGRLSDNPYIDRESYIAQLSGLSDVQRRALLDGDWNVIEGAFFREWNSTVHVVAPFEIPSHWIRFRAMDYGYTNPMCCLWFAADGDGNLYVYRELYGTDMTPPIQARRILEMSHNERADYTVADPSVWTKTGAGAPIAQQYADAGLHCRRAMNARVDGWSRVRSYLRPDPERADPEREDYVPPKLYVFDHCRNLIRTLPLMVHDKNNPEDLDTETEDHAVDALRYGCMSRPRPVKEGKVEDQSLEARLSRKHSQRRARRGGSGPFVGSAP